MNNEILYHIALTLIPNIGAVQSKQLIDYFGNAENIFKAKLKDLSAVDGIGEIRANQIKKFNQFALAEAEIKFAEKQQIKILYLTHQDYPKRLLHCYDAPTVLYYKGNANLNAEKIVSIIGTRTNTDYGKQITEDIIEELSHHQVLVVSGLAFGIDALAHKSALKNSLPTVGVLAHGLDTIYPAQHKSLAKEMLHNGGLLTEFKTNTTPDKFNFPQRNRIVAGIADATIVIETATKGGSMITAEIAYNYNRDVFAIPGKVYDNKSSGCLSLIQQNKAVLLAKPTQLIEEMQWITHKKQPKKQRELFIDLSPNEQKIVDILKNIDSIGIDDLYLKSELSSSSVAGAILNLELQNIIIALPGKLYKLRE